VTAPAVTSGRDGRAAMLLGRRRRDELTPGRYLLMTSMVMLAIITLGFVVSMVLVTRLDEDVAQARAFSHFRGQLAAGVAPTGQVDSKGRLLAPGAPVARIQIPALGLSAVVLEGTSSSVLAGGPGHQRSTVLPGQAGTSVIFGRAAAYGGPFGNLHHLRAGDTIHTTTGIGTSTFKVIDVRRAGDPVPPVLKPGSARLILVTATGAPFLPSGVLRVDADIQGSAEPDSSMVLTSVGKSELPLGTDTSQLWGLAFVLEALLVVSIAAAWLWRTWGRVPTWIVLAPLVALLLWTLQGQVTRLLPNLT